MALSTCCVCKEDFIVATMPSTAFVAILCRHWTTAPAEPSRTVRLRIEQGRTACEHERAVCALDEPPSGTHLVLDVSAEVVGLACSEQAELVVSRGHTALNIVRAAAAATSALAELVHFVFKAKKWRRNAGKGRHAATEQVLRASVPAAAAELSTRLVVSVSQKGRFPWFPC